MQSKGTILHMDNQSAIATARNPIHHGRTKHIRVKYHALKDAVKDQEIKLRCCHIENQLANIFTKVMNIERFEMVRSHLGVHQIFDHVDVLKNGKKFGEVE